MSGYPPASSLHVKLNLNTDIFETVVNLLMQLNKAEWIFCTTCQASVLINGSRNLDTVKLDLVFQPDA